MKRYKRVNQLENNFLTLVAVIVLTISFGHAAEKVENSVVANANTEFDFGNAVLDRLVSKINEGYFLAHI